MKKIIASRPYLYAELLMLSVGMPLALSTILPLRFLLPCMWLTALYGHIVYRALADLPETVYWRWKQVNWGNMRPMLVRFALCVVLTTVFVALWRPHLFLSFVCEKPKFWAFVMVAYPLLSVVPQEMIFRTFFFQRYRPLFRKEVLMIPASAIIFAAAHLIFQNWVAPFMCLIGGYFFAQTYAKTRSLALVAIEHALYGCMVFTIGLGTYFYHGAVYSNHEVNVSPACAYIGDRVDQLRAHLF